KGVWLRIRNQTPLDDGSGRIRFGTFTRAGLIAPRCLTSAGSSTACVRDECSLWNTSLHAPTGGGAFGCRGGPVDGGSRGADRRRYNARPRPVVKHPTTSPGAVRRGSIGEGCVIARD